MSDGVVKIDVILDDSKVGGGIKKVEGRLSGIGSTAKRGLATVGKLAGALGLVGLAYKGIDMVKSSLDGAIDRYDTLNRFPRVMQLMGFDAQDSERAIKKLSDGVQGLPTRLDDVARTAQNIAVMTNDLDGAVDTTIALNNAFIASGASAADVNRGMEMYINMLASGEVDIVRWRSLQETMGVALNKTAEAFGYTGKSAQQDLYQALKDGEITFDEFNSKIIELSNAQGGFADMAQEASGGIKTAWTNLSTWIVTGVAKVIGAIDKAMGGTGEIADAINRLKPIVQGVFGWIADVAIPAVASAIKSVKGFIEEWFPPLELIQEKFMMLFEFFQAIAIPIFQESTSFMMEIWSHLTEFFKEHGEMIWEAIENLMMFIFEIMQFIWPAVQFLIVDTWEAIKNTIMGAIDVILGIIQLFSALLTGDFSAAWDAVKRIFSGALKLLWGLINLWFVGKILKGVKAFAKLFGNVFRTLWNSVKGIFNSGVKVVQGVVSRGFNFIRSIVSSVMNAVRSVISSIWNGIRSVITSVVNAIRSVISSGFNTARSIVTSTVNAIRSVVSSVFNALRGIVSGAMGGVRSAVSTGIRGALNVVTNIGKSFFNAGKNIVTSIANGIKSAIGKVTDAIGNVTSKIRSFLPFSPAKEGALKDIMKVRISESIAETIRKGRSKAIKEMDLLASGLAQTIEPEVNLLGDLKGLTANSVIGNIPTTSHHMIQEIKQKQSKVNKHDDSKVIELLKQLVDKDGNVYLNQTKVGSIMDKEQARRIKLLEGWVAID